MSFSQALTDADAAMVLVCIEAHNFGEQDDPFAVIAPMLGWYTSSGRWLDVIKVLLNYPNYFNPRPSKILLHCCHKFDSFKALLASPHYSDISAEFDCYCSQHDDLKFIKAMLLSGKVVSVQPKTHYNQKVNNLLKRYLEDAWVRQFWQLEEDAVMINVCLNTLRLWALRENVYRLKDSPKYHKNDNVKATIAKQMNEKKRFFSILLRLPDDIVSLVLFKLENCHHKTVVPKHYLQYVYKKYSSQFK